MTLTEILEIADHLIYSQTRKHLDNLQEAVIKGVWQGQTYQVIADECQHSESRVRDVGYKLWEILSEQLGEDINKSNFRSTLERLYLTSSKFINMQTSHNFQFSSYCHQSLDDQRQGSSNQEPYLNLKQAPQINQCYGRDNELLTLTQWLKNPNINLISILGIAGIGKSTLVRYFLNLNTPNFDIIIWKNLKLYQSFNFNISEILNDTHINSGENLFNKFINLLNNKRCLIIFDNIEEIFISKQLVGVYKSEYQDYQKLFKIITETQHQSKLILISQEKCSEMYYLEQKVCPIKFLELSGLNNISILGDRFLNNENSWLKLIQIYEGNLIYLKGIINLIEDVYDGDIDSFLAENLAENSLIITQDMESHFKDLFNRLSLIEQQIVLELSKSDKPISKEELKQNLPLSSVNFIKGLESLQQRYLVSKIKVDQILFKLSPVFRAYVINSCKDLF
jgi:hypothetical protein